MENKKVKVALWAATVKGSKKDSYWVEEITNDNGFFGEYSSLDSLASKVGEYFKDKVRPGNITFINQPQIKIVSFVGQRTVRVLTNNELLEMMTKMIYAFD